MRGNFTDLPWRKDPGWQTCVGLSRAEPLKENSLEKLDELRCLATKDRQHESIHAVGRVEAPMVHI